MVVPLCPVVLGAALQMRVRDDSQFLHQLEGAVDGRRVDLGEALGHRLRRDMAAGAHDLGDNRPPLLRYAVSPGLQGIDDVIRLRHQIWSPMRFIGGRSTTLRSKTRGVGPPSPGRN